MHTFSENSSGVPAFLAKLWRLVEDEETNNLIYWSADGKSFIIQNQAQFAREILPLNYKHNNMASFIRQLNMYGFHKITSLDGGGLKFDRDEMEFSHPYFQRDHPYLLEHIKRKISTAKTTQNTDDKANIKHEIVSKVLTDVKLMKGRQDSLDNRFISMKQENEALWREVAILRQKHMKQQQIVNKLIQFLVTIVQPQRGSGIGSMGGMGGVKRRYQLMINDIPDAAKIRKTTRNNSDTGTGTDGPIIRELTEELFDNYSDGVDDDAANSPYVVSPGSFPTSSINDYDECDNIDDVDADQIIAEDGGAVVVDGTTVSTNASSDDSSGSVYNTADYASDLIYDVANSKTSASAIDLIQNSAAIGTSSVDNIAVEELLDNVTAAVTAPDSMATYIKQENKNKQPILVQTHQNVKQTINPKLVANRKQLPGNVIIANAGGNMQGMKRLPIVKIASNQIPNNQLSAAAAAAGIRQINASGKSLIDAQKLKAAKQQQQQLQNQQHQQQQQQHQQQQIIPQKQIIQTIPQPGNKPILITVGRAQTPVSTTAAAAAVASQQSATAASMGKTYKNKDDFISSEIPAELFQDDTSQGNFDETNLMNNVNNINNANNLNVNHLTGEFGQSVPASPGTSSGVDNFNKNMTIARYNSKGTTHDDIMRISSQSDPSNYRDQLNSHLDGVQGDLEALKEFLRDGDNYQVDANTLLSNPQNPSVLSGINGESISSIINKLFGDNDVFQQYGIPMNPTDTTNIPGLVERQRDQNDASANNVTGSELISYNQPDQQTPIDFTDFLNLDDSQLASDAAAAMSAYNMPTQNNVMPQMPCASPINGNLTTPNIKQEQFAYPK